MGLVLCDRMSGKVCVLPAGWLGAGFQFSEFAFLVFEVSLEGQDGCRFATVITGCCFVHDMGNCDRCSGEHQPLSMGTVSFFDVLRFWEGQVVKLLLLLSVKREVVFCSDNEHTRADTG